AFAFFFQAEDGIRDFHVTGVQTCALPICMAVQSRVFPLVEVEHGTDWRFTIDPEHVPVQDYIRAQGRFRHLTDEQIRHISDAVEIGRASCRERVEEAEVALGWERREEWDG